MILTLLKAFLIVLVAIPLSLVALVSTPIDRTGRTFHLMSRLWSMFILWMFGIKVRTKGKEHLEPENRYIYISNHASAFDIPTVVVGIPDNIRFVLKKELTRIPIWGWALKYGHYISIDRGKARDALKSLDEAAERMRKGASVILFCEGTRTVRWQTSVVQTRCIHARSQGGHSHCAGDDQQYIQDPAEGIVRCASGRYRSRS